MSHKPPGLQADRAGTKSKARMSTRVRVWLATCDEQFNCDSPGAHPWMNALPFHLQVLDFLNTPTLDNLVRGCTHLRPDGPSPLTLVNPRVETYAIAISWIALRS